MVACKQVLDEDEVMVVTQNGIMIRTAVGGISRIGRNTQGVRVINLDADDKVIDMTRVAQSSEEEAAESADDDGSPPEDAGESAGDRSSPTDAGDGSSTDSGNGREDEEGDEPASA